MSEKESEKKINWKRNLVVIWISQILAMAGFSSALPFIPIYIRDTWQITDEKELGLWMSAFYFFGMLSFCVATPIWGILADRFGRKLMLLRAFYIDAILFPCFLLAPNPVILIVIRFITSAFTGTISAAQTLIVTTTPENRHGVALGTLSTAVWSGNLLGVALGGFLVHHFGFTCAFLSCGVMYLIGGLLAQFGIQENFQSEPKHSQTRSNSLRYLSVSICLLFLLIIIMAVARRFDEPYIAMMVEKIHGPEDTAIFTGKISAFAAIGGIISGIVIGRLCDRFSPEKITLPAVLFASITMFLQASAPTLSSFGLARFLNYLAAGGLEPICMSILAKISPPERRGTFFGLASAIRMVGILAGSLLSGTVIYFVGVRQIFSTAGFLFLLIIPVFFLMIHFLPKGKNQS